MKNIQVIDGAQNCTYSIYAATDDEFSAIFPGDGQDIEFISDFIRRRRVGGESASRIMNNIWTRPVNKPDANGIHGTLFYELDHKKAYYPTKRECEMIVVL